MTNLHRSGDSTQVVVWQQIGMAVMCCAMPLVACFVPSTSLAMPSAIFAVMPVPVVQDWQLRTSTTLNPPAAMIGTRISTTVPSVLEPALLEKQFTRQQRADNAYRNAIGLIETGRGSLAIVILEPLLLDNPTNSAARLLLAGLLIENNRLNEARWRLHAGLEIEPLHLEMTMMLARLQASYGNFQEAIRTLQKVAAVSNGQANYLGFLAALLQRESRYRESAEHYAQALQTEPHNGIWWMGYGIALQADNQREAALEAFRLARDSPGLSVQLRAFVDQSISQILR
jgi:MSHA biogenesis protein MshN